MTKEFFKAKTVLDPIEFWGVWSIPQQGTWQEELSGLLKFQRTSHGNLTICGDMIKTPLLQMESYPVLWGRSFASGKAISIFDAFVSQAPIIPLHKKQPVTIRFSEYWEGDVFFKNREDVKFKSLSFGIHNLETWHNLNSYEMSCSKGLKKIKMNYIRPSNLDLFEDENVTIKLGYAVGGPGMGYGQTVSSIKQSARIVITSKRGRLLPFYGNTHSFQYYMNLIFCLLSLLIGKNTFIYDICGTIKKARPAKDKRDLGLHATRFWRQDIVASHLKDLNITNLTFPYWYVKDCLKNAICQYNTYHLKISHLVLEIVEYQNRHQPIDRHLLSQFIFLFEGIIRTLYEAEIKEYHEKKILTDEYEMMKKSVFGLCDSKQKKWLNDHLPPYPKFREYYDVALKNTKDLFPYMFDENGDERFSSLADDMFRYLRKERTKIAHAAGESASDTHLYVYTLRWMHLFLVFTILKKCGISTEIFKNRLKNTLPVYNSTKKYISALLAENASKI